MVLKFILVIIASCVSLIAGYALTKRFGYLSKSLAVLGFVILWFSVLPRLSPAYFYFLFPSHFFLEVLLACAFLLIGVLSARYSDTLFRGVINGILVLLMVYFILFPTGYLAFHSEYIKSLHYKVKDGVTIQSGNFGCVPSSIATILRLYGLEYTEGDLSYALHTTTMGTDYSRIPRVVRAFGKSKGLRATFMRTNLTELNKLDKPAILYVYVGRMKHATALLGFEGDEVILGEPLVGIRRIKINDFQNQTQWSGLATVISEEAI